MGFIFIIMNTMDALDEVYNGRTNRDEMNERHTWLRDFPFECIGYANI